MALAKLKASQSIECLNSFVHDRSWWCAPLWNSRSNRVFVFRSDISFIHLPKASSHLKITFNESTEIRDDWNPLTFGTCYTVYTTLLTTWKSSSASTENLFKINKAMITWRWSSCSCLDTTWCLQTALLMRRLLAETRPIPWKSNLNRNFCPFSCVFRSNINQPKTRNLIKFSNLVTSF